jgi:hypothetical protein
LSKFIHNFFHRKEQPKKILKGVQSKQLPNWQKFAKSGHPAHQGIPINEGMIQLKLETG